MESVVDLLTWLKSNYRDIHRPYGTLDDVDHLIKELKQRGMKLIMDLVVNHTSNQVRIPALFVLFDMADKRHCDSTPGLSIQSRQAKARSEIGISGESQNTTLKASLSHQTTGAASSTRLN